MGDPIADVELAMAIVGDIQKSLPILSQSVADIKQAYADKADPTKSEADFAKVLGDISQLTMQLQGVLQSQNP